MRIAILHKRKHTSKGVEEYLKNSEKITSYVTHALLEQPLSSISFKGCDVVVLDLSDDSGDTNDILLVMSLRTLIGTVPIFLVTDISESALYREKMFDAGVDGAIQKPFSQEELVLRLSKLVYKKENLRFTGTVISTHDVAVDLRTHIVAKKGEAVSLTKTEYGILFHLIVHKNTIVSPSSLSLYLQESIHTGSSALNIHILNIRRKLGREGFIRTIPHYGFMIS